MSAKPFSVAFEVPIQPTGKGRHKSAVIKGRIKNYADPKTARWEDRFALLASAHRPPAPLRGPIMVSAVFVFKRPKRLMRKKDVDGMIWHKSRPDVDNCAKALLDALQLDGGWFGDDCQIAFLNASKTYHEKNGAPRIKVFVRELDEAQDPSINR